MNGGSGFSLEHRIVRTEGDVRIFHVEGRVIRDRAGRPLRLIGAGQDITDRRQAEIVARSLITEQAARAAAEAAERRADFLAEASRLLGSSFDYQATMATLMKLAVPRLADFATFDLVKADGGIERIAVAHVEPEKEALLWALRRWLHVSGPIRHQLRDPLFDGKSVFVAEVTDAMVASTVIDEEHGAIVAQIRPRSLMTVALMAGGEVRGALALYSSESGRRFDASDLALAEELARRASLAVENARLFEAAESATRARDQMLGIVAHDLRNPLGTIRMAAGLLEEVLEAASPARKQVAMVTRAVDRMNRLIGDLLDVKRLENGRLSVELRPCPSIAALSEAVDMLKVVAAAAGLELVLDVPRTLPAVMADANRIQQVLSNLIGNAMKFTPKGGRITVSGALDRDYVRVSVADTGSGIPPEQLPHIFSQFWQGSKTDKRGIGLGLSIAKGIVEAHGGRIWVESTIGAGTSFYFTLLAAQSDS
jgi:signal transduction histidine kinase